MSEGLFPVSFSKIALISQEENIQEGVTRVPLKLSIVHDSDANDRL